MALPQTVETLEDIPQPLREHYVERQGKWHLDTETDPRLAMARRDSVEEKRKRQDLEKKLQEVQQELETVKTRRRTDDDDEPTDSRRLQRQREEADRQMRDLQTQVQVLQGQLSQTSSTLTRERIGSRLRGAAQKAGLLSHAVEDAVKWGMDVFKQDGDGKVAAFEGEERLLGKSGDDMTMDEWLNERRQDKPHWFQTQGTGNTGGSANHQGSAPSQRARPRRRSEMTASERAHLIEDIGMEPYLRLPW
jgi:hypothetical protein